MKNREETKEGLFFKVGIDNIKGGLIRDLGWDGFGVLVAIASFADDKGECFPSQKLLAEICGVDRKTINRKIKKLVEYRKDGQPIIEKKTIREGQTKTRTYYRILPAAGIAFGSNKVVPNEGQPNNVKKSVEVVPNQSHTLYQISPKGSTNTGTLRKSIEQNPLNKNNIEQDNTPNGGNSDFGNTNFVEERYNKDDINRDLESNKFTESKTDKIGDYYEYGDNLTPKEIVANNTENKNDINENNDTGHGAGTTTSVKPSSESYLKARERNQEKKREEQAVKERENAASETHNSPDMPAKEDVNGVSIEMKEERLESKNKADDDEFFALLKEVQEEFKGMGV